MKTASKNFGTIFALTLACGLAANLKAQNIYVADESGRELEEYVPSGAKVNGFYISGDAVYGIAASGNDLFIANNGDSTIGEYGLDGTRINTSLILLGLNSSPLAIAISGNNLFVANSPFNGIGEYTTSGAVVDASLISGLHDPSGIAISGTNLFVVNFTGNTIGEYTTSGATVNASLVSGLSEPNGIVISGTNLFVSNAGNATIGEYSTSGATVNASLITGLSPGPLGIAISGNNLFVTYGESAAVVGEYTTTGATVNTNLISGLYLPIGIAIGPAPQLSIAAAGSQNVLAYPAWATNYVLQCAATLTSTNWLLVTNNVSVMTVTNGAPAVAVTISNNLPASFFRLAPAD